MNMLVSKVDLDVLPSELQINSSLLDPKKEQTTKKIEYIKNYVEKWLYVWSNEESSTSITFIDAMTNAGIYRDGDFGTALEVYRLFYDFAKENPKIRYNLHINDINGERIDICKKIIDYISVEKPSNLHVRSDNKDVNVFLQEAACSDSIPKGYGKAVLLFVDPYDARTVHLDSIRKFVQSRYCEVLFNWFSSDYTRNRETNNYEAIRDCFDGLVIPEDEDATTAVSNALRVGDIRFVFSYPFRISTNIELYQIIFLTPSSAGLEKLKDALWETFQGAEYHRNTSQNKSGQMSMFDLEVGKQFRIEHYATEAKHLLCNHFQGRSNVPYSEIISLILERTMLRKGQIIKHVLRPLVNDGFIKKDGFADPRNYTHDTFSFA